jgi:hypothetical protein
MQAVSAEVGRIAPGEPFASARLLPLGSRAAVDQALARLARQGAVCRVRRGIYVRPRESRLVGPVPPAPADVVAAIARATGETIALHGAEAARQLGLTTQTPMGLVYDTSGNSRHVHIGKQTVQLRHTSSRWLALAGSPAGLALSALRYLGKQLVTEDTIDHVRSRIGDEQYSALRGATHAVPGWLHDVLRRADQRRWARTSDRRHD